MLTRIKPVISRSERTALRSLHAEIVPDGAADADRALLRAWAGRLPLVALILAAAGFVAFGLAESWSDSPTFDEPVYVAAGIGAVLHHDLTLNDEHPPLPKALAALPVLLAHPVVPGNGPWSGNDEHSYSARFVSAQLSAGTLRRVTFAARLVPLAETIGVAFAAFALGSELFGAVAGAFAGILWLASPFVLGIGHLDGTDIPFALAVALGSWALARWLRLRSTRALVWVGLALAAAAASQITGLLVAATGLAVIAAAGRRSGVRHPFAAAGLAALVIWVTLWASYIILDPGVGWQPTILVPRPYLDGIAYLATHDTGAVPGYLAGFAYTGGRWWFWPLSLLIKWPTGSVLLLAAGLISWRWLAPVVRRRALLAVGVPAIVLTAFTILMPKDVGLRYLLPVLALCAAAAGGLVPVLASLRQVPRRVIAAGLAGLLTIGAATTIGSFPDSLAWTAWPFRPAYAVVTDSNVDWGQGLYLLRSWSAGRQPWVTYFGPRGLDVAAIPSARSLIGTAPTLISGWVAVSATALTSADRSSLAWLRAYCPVGTLAGSILVYHFRRPPTPPLHAPARPAGLCRGNWSAASRS
jgi:4-amino-4-deoxy-L-arabinose transferase-like glycosyltransferase